MMKITSSAFEEDQRIPVDYTGDGQDVSPSLQIHDAPEETVSFALIMDDPDAPRGTFDHWMVWGIPPQTREIAEGETFQHQGKNGFGETGYRGPSPPPGKVHHYHFQVYALDSDIDLPAGATKDQLKQEMNGHILDQAKLIGVYQR